MAQRYEVEAWINPDAWDDQTEAKRVIDAIIESGTETTEDWTRIAGGDDEDRAGAAEADFDQADQAEARDTADGDTANGDPGQMWTVARVAAELGLTISTVYAYRRDGRMPEEDGMLGRTPWWHPGTITAWTANRPGQGVGGGRPRKDQ